MKHLQISYYDKEKHTFGPFTSIYFVCITQSIPSNLPTTVTYQCFSDEGNTELVTVPICGHSIEPV